MEFWQKSVLVFYLFFGVFGLSFALRKVYKKKDNLGLVGPFVIYGAFVWADLVVFGVFWSLFTLISLFLNDWILFLLGQSVFWFIRSLGESFYWFNQQFSTIKRYDSRDFFFAKFFGNDDYTVWFVMQILMQWIAVVSAILSLYFGKLWLDRF